MSKGIFGILVSLLLLTCSAVAEERNFTVGILASLTGNWAQIGRNLEQGATLARDEINANGGVLGAKLIFDIQDTDEEKTGAKVVSAYHAMRRRGIRFFVGPTGVPGIMALAPLAAKDDVIVIAPTSTNSFYKDSAKFFNASGDNRITTEAIAQRTFERGFRRVAIFGSLQPWEQDQASTFKERFLALGGAIVAEQYPMADQVDLRTEALRIVRAKPDAVFFAIFNQVASAAKMLRQHGFNGGMFASIMDDAHIAASGGALDSAELYLFNAPGPTFVDTFKKRFGTEPGLFADSAYDAVVSLGRALNAAGTLDRDAVITALHKNTFTGSSGKLVGYDRDGLLARDITRHEIRRGALVKDDG
jgi:branched-chain amino acid transport system substrate-binding protein